jgi:hypothetical protein
MASLKTLPRDHLWPVAVFEGIEDFVNSMTAHRRVADVRQG